MWRRWIVAAGFGVHGAGMAVAPDEYTSGSYSVLMDIASMRSWGLLFMAVALVCAVPPMPRPVVMAVLAGFTGVWAFGLTAAQLPGENGQSPTAPVVWLMLLGLIMWSAAQPADG